MKNTLFLGLAIVTLFFSCTTDDTADIIINDNSITNNNGGGETPSDSCEAIPAALFTSNLVLQANKCYTISGPVIMASGSSLIINEGVTIKAEASGADVYIAISQGANIVANGTASNPIVMTSAASNPAAGDWGGLIVLGKAPINSVTGSATSTSEIASLPYGGMEAADDSGTIRYLRLEYSGGAADGQSENNGISFYGVGNGTTVEYVQVFEGKDDGVEFFGGTVNVSFLSVINAQDDSIDWTEGYTGTITNAYVKHGADHDKAIEADGFNTDFSNAAGYYSKPNVNNLTIVGVGNTAGTEAIRLRAGTQGIFNNVLIQGFEEGFDLDGDSGDNPTGAGVLSGDLNVTNVTFTDVTTKVKNDTGVTFNINGDFIISGDGNGTGTTYSNWSTGWTVE